MSEVVEQGFWQDREVRFDIPSSQLQPRRGEREIDAINAVEDTKGNNGMRGALSVTNLRMLWVSHVDPKTNLSVGLGCISSLSIKVTSSKLRGNTQALHVMTRYNNTRFEFIFTSLVKNSPRLFTSAQAVHKSYESTKLYRDLKLRGAIIKDKKLMLLPAEEIYNQVQGVWNLSSEQGNLGTFFITNVRVVWHANLAENFNVSIPYLQIKTIKIRDSKFGHALVIETSAASGNYILGFRVDPKEMLFKLHKEISTFNEVYSKNPNFGIQYSLDDKPCSDSEAKVHRKQDDVEIIQTDAGHSFEAEAAYCADGEKSADKEPVYSSELGLAVESLPDGTSMKQLWTVVHHTANER